MRANILKMSIEIPEAFLFPASRKEVGLSPNTKFIRLGLTLKDLA